MDLKLNNSEAIFILQLIDDHMNDEFYNQGLGKATMESILKKISGSVRYQANKVVDEYAVMMINYYKEGE